MPVNLPPEAQAAREKYLNADTLQEKIITLQEFISLVPRHKGAENLLANLKTRLSKLKAKSEEERLRRKGTGIQFHLRKEGDAQVVLAGLTCVGRSSLLNTLTGSRVEIGDWAFTTQKPEPGMLLYEGVRIHLVEAPAIFERSSAEGIGIQVLSFIRNADSIALVVDLSQDVLGQMKIIEEEFELAGIRINATPPPVEVEKTGSGGIQIIGGVNLLDGGKGEIIDLLNKKGIYNAVVKIWGPISLDQIVESIDASIVYKSAIIVATKGDMPGSAQNYEILKKNYDERFKIAPVSVLKNIGLEELKQEILTDLELIRVFTKDPEEGIAKKPIVLKKGATVGDVSRILHSSFFKNFRFAKIWGPSVKHDGSKVGIDHVLDDNDIVQIFAH